MAQETPQECIARLGLSVHSVFVPFSQSRNKAESHKSLNWKVTLVCNNPEYGQARQGDIMMCDYSAGTAHCPAYALASDSLKFERLSKIGAIAQECETGKTWSPQFSIASGKPILPNPVDVIYSLVIDSDALDYARFEDWADSFGYDPDSRSAESTYRACLEIALQLRNGIGESALAALQSAFQDY